MKTMYQIFVSGIPKAQPRPRMAGNGRVYNPHSADAWKGEIKAAFIACWRGAIADPVSLKAVFYLPMPKRPKNAGECTAHAVKPDLDNLLKAAMDAMTSARVWEDDSQVYKIESEKRYSPSMTGAQIIIEA